MFPSINFVAPLHLKWILLAVISPGWIFCVAFPALTHRTHDGAKGGVIWSEWTSVMVERAEGGPSFLPPLSKQVKKNCLLWAAAFWNGCLLFWLRSDFWALYTENLHSMESLPKPANLLWLLGRGQHEDDWGFFFLKNHSLVLVICFTTYMKQVQICGILMPKWGIVRMWGFGSFVSEELWVLGIVAEDASTSEMTWLQCQAPVPDFSILPVWSLRGSRWWPKSATRC